MAGDLVGRVRGEGIPTQSGRATLHGGNDHFLLAMLQSTA